MADLSATEATGRVATGAALITGPAGFLAGFLSAATTKEAQMKQLTKTRRGKRVMEGFLRIKPQGLTRGFI